MAYNFNGSPDKMEFSITPFSGHVFGAFTFAVFIRRAVANTHVLLSFTTSTDGDRMQLYFSGNNPAFETADGGNVAFSTASLTSTSLWYLIAVTWDASSNPRFHIHDGTSWSHASFSNAAATTIASTSKLKFGVRNPAAGQYFNGDVACCGIKNADSSDGTIQTLSRTSFPAWQAFGFDWLIGFDASTTRNNQGALTGGNETSRTGTSLVADPPSWVWISVVTPAANFTGTPTSGTASLSVTFTDTSTNTPTSWAWDFGDGGTSTAQNPTHSYSTSGVFTVTLIATNAAGSDTKTRTGYITVNEAVVYAAGGGIDIW